MAGIAWSGGACTTEHRHAWNLRKFRRAKWAPGVPWTNMVWSASEPRLAIICLTYAPTSFVLPVSQESKDCVFRGLWVKILRGLEVGLRCIIFWPHRDFAYSCLARLHNLRSVQNRTTKISHWRVNFPQILRGYSESRVCGESDDC